MAPTNPGTVRVGIVAPSSAVPMVELSLGVDRMRAAGFAVRVHPQCGSQYFTFAGTDAQRGAAFYEYATDLSIDVVWAARGGYGATRLLPELDRITAEQGVPPRKLLVGYSDVTALHEYVRSRWNWSTLHANMPAVLDFMRMSDADWQTTVDWVCRTPVPMPWRDGCLKFLTVVPTRPIRGLAVGGNVSVWQYLVGTPYAPPQSLDRILFLEETDEQYYRIDAMINQIDQAGGFDGVAAIVLGEFWASDDRPGQVFGKAPAADAIERAVANPESFDRKPLRPHVGEREALVEIFAHRAEARGIPVAYQLPVGHGPRFAPLALGAIHELTPDGEFNLVSWPWLDT